MVETAKVRLVTVIAAFELQERLVKDLRALGVKGYTLGKADGRGMHGHRMAGLADAPNMRLEMLVDRALAERVLERVVSKYADQPIMGYAHDVEAVPRDYFS
ncbi:MAG: P-II family nitrogen regulator [Polyangiaceae bacterium]